jgi:predicted alpha/beta hydrolase family esterase
MSKKVLLIHGGGGGAAKEDAQLASNLRKALGDAYQVDYPNLPNEEEPDYRVWKTLILKKVAELGGAILVGHSIGASVLIRILSDEMPKQQIDGLFLVAAPFWHDDDFWHWDEVELPADVSSRVPRDLPVFFYHGEADEVVPVAHVEMYAKALPRARIRRLPGRNHQLDDDMSEVARDIQALA